MVSIRLQSDADLSIKDFAAAITQKLGEPLDRRKVAESLKNLYATGRFLDLRADAEPAVNGVNLVFVARAQYFVGIVRVEGTPGSLEPRVLVTASRLRLGLPLSPEDLTAAHDHLAELLAANGYYQARVEHRLPPDPHTQEVDVVFLVSPGRPARVSSVEFRNHAAFPPERLAAVAGWRSGTQLTSARVERGLSKIHQFYVAHGRLQASTSILKRVYDPKLNTERILVLAESGPLVRVRVQGAQISTSKLRELLPVFRDGLVDDSSLARSARTLEDHFQRQGYLSASVKPERVFRADSQELDVTFQANLGERGEFAGYGISGNRSVPTGRLLAAISPQTRGLLQPAPVFSRELLENKTNALRTLYQSEGFLDVQVTPRIDEHWKSRPGCWFVAFEIEEGPRTTVRQLILHGLGTNTQEKLWPLLLTRPSQPYSVERARRDRDSIAGYLADRGYTHAGVSWHASPADSKGRVDVEFRIESGPQERVQRIVLLGNRHTRAATVRRELEFRNGRALSQSDLLESQRRLYDLGVFNQVQIATQEQPSSNTNKTVLVGVEEGRRWTVGYGGGAEVQRLGSNKPQGQFKASPRLSLDVTRVNVGGRAQTFTIRGRLSNLEKGGGLSYLIPRLFAQRDLSLRINGLLDRSRDVLTFTAEREEASVSIEKRYSPDTFLLGKYSYRRVLVDPSTLHIQPEAIPLLSRPARIAMFGLGYVNDRRDDPTDATNGSYSVADAGISWRKLASEASFLRFSGQNATYYRLGSRVVFARNTRFGVESPYGALREVRIPGPNATTQVVLTHDIPLPERYFMGGSESHRGFSINQAGPRDPLTGFPIGGNALFFNSFELRMPLAEKRLGFVVFHDAGNVFSSVRTMRLLKVSQSSPTDFDYASHAVGLGVRYRTPVGPVRFDMGYNLNPPRFQVEGPGGMEVRRLSQVQFFLSIGQSF